MNVMKETAKEIRETKAKQRVTSKEIDRAMKLGGEHLRRILSLDEQEALGIRTSDATFEQCITVLKTLAKERIEAKRASANTRVALIEEKYQRSLAKGIAYALGIVDAMPVRTIGQLSKGGEPTWASIEKRTLHTAYMIGAVPQLTMHEAHPGSRSGLFIVDLRDLSPFAMADGNRITLLSILARVVGKARPHD